MKACNIQIKKNNYYNDMCQVEFNGDSILLAED